MCIEKYNSEGYYDPTTYEALTQVEREERKKAFKPVVYVCSPYAGDVENNTIKAREYCRFAVEQNCIPLAPHLLLPQFMDDDNPQERELAMFMNKVILSKCKELWVFGETVSKGMAVEIETAKRRNQTIRYFDSDCTEVFYE